VTLAGRTLVVTGGSRGIGRSVAELAGRRGARVIAVGRDEIALAEVSRRTGGSFVVADLRRVEAAQQVVSRVLGDHGGIDGVVCAAGIGHRGAFAAMPEDRLSEIVDTNLRAPILLARAALPALQRSEHGALVFVTSIAGLLGVPDEAVYSASKAGLVAFADLLREELRGTGVTVSAVAPGVVDTEFFARRGAPYHRSRPRPISPDRVAGLVLRALETGPRRRVEPRWLAAPAWLSAAAPGVYRALARRWG
jgi:short-subunit dehydrogenase